MEDVVWYRKPLLSDPVAILAFEGWSDAGNTQVVVLKIFAVPMMSNLSQNLIPRDFITIK